MSRRRTLALTVFVAIALVLIAWSQFGAGWGSTANPFLPLPGRLESWAAITVAICVQSFPFLVLGVSISASIEAFAPPGFLQKITPRNPVLAVPVASVAAVGLPGCECASVPVAQSFIRNGVDRSAALVFMLASPAVNPVVLVSTAVAFYALPGMVWARLVASFAAVIAAGWLWLAISRRPQATVAADSSAVGASHTSEPDSHFTVATDLVSTPVRGNQSGTWPQKLRLFQQAALHDLTQAGGFLVLGAIAAGFVKVMVPISWFHTVSQRPTLAVLVMALLAILLSLCSEADAFVAASFTAVSPTAQLAFMVVGPMIDIKLISMQIGAFGIKFVRAFIPLVLACALLSSATIGFLFFGAL
ncbi:permease [Boudabousia marimammalium]|uniref:Permease n=1 Tax=Boudabousia marimammalium TaxID=156892 RepID=A0A1Q5PKG7_9ACTO|nr:permease [Boudabousia marimammalium]OKL46706.1 hypothetical protein BM477_07065 [Boudabousia marimammalium]